MSPDEQSPNEILRAVARTLPEPVFVLDEDGRYVQVIGGTSREKYADPRGLIGRTLYDVMEREKADWFRDRIHEALEQGQIVTNEYALGSDDLDNPDRGSGPEGAQWFEASVVPLGISHQGRRLVAWIAYNATDRHDLLVRLESQGEQLRRQKEELQNLALTDDLTELANRRHFLSIFDHEFRKVSSERSEALSLIVLDLDHFKRINDTKGHAAGDVALETVAQLLCASVRVSDLVARIGGEEFAVLLPNTTLEDATEVADKIVTMIKNTPIRITGGVIRCTASLGVAAFAPEDRDHYALLKRADDALYRAKAQGRDRWCRSA